MNKKMNKTLLVLALTAACGLGASSAQAKDLTGWFVNGGVGTAHYHASLYDYDVGTESDTAYQFNVGWRSQFIGFEAGYVNLGSVNEKDSYGNSASLSGRGVTLGLNGHFNPTNMWYISARGGLFSWKLNAKAALVDADGDVNQYSAHDSAMDWYAGVGTGVDFNRHMSLGANFDYYTINKHGYDIGNRVYTINFEYRF